MPAQAPPMVGQDVPVSLQPQATAPPAGAPPPLGGDVPDTMHPPPQMNFAIVNGQRVNLDDSPLARAWSEYYQKSPIGGAVGLAKGTAKAVGLTGEGFHPIDVLFDQIKHIARSHWDEAVTAAEKAKSAAGAVAGPWTEANAKAAHMDTIEALGHGLAALIPVLGPLAANSGEHGAKGDLAGMVGGFLGLTTPFAAKYGLETAKAANPAKADLLTREAQQQVSERVLAPGNPRYKGKAAAVAPEILDRNLQGGRLELQQMADEGMDAAGTKIDASVNRYGGQQAQIPLRTIVSLITQRIDELTVNGAPIPTAAGRVKALAKLRDYLDQRGQSIPFEQLKTIRDDFYGEAAKKGGYDRIGNQRLSDSAWAAREAGSAIREGLAQLQPETAAHYAEYAFWKTLSDVLDPALGRPKTGLATTGVTGGLHTTGAIIGQGLSHIPGVQALGALVVSKLLPMLREAQASPAWQLASAAKKAELAAAIKAGNIGKAQGLMLSISKLTPAAGVFNPALPVGALAGTPATPTDAGARR